METNVYIIMFLTVVGTALSVYVILIPIMIWLEVRRKKDDEKMAAFLRHMEIESQKNTRETQRRIDENHTDATSFIKAMHKETSLILGRIFEIVDDPEEKKG
jgi:hypothetical protein